MKTLSVTATQAGHDDDEGALVAGVAREALCQYVAFQREVEDGGEDWGVHLECSEQINGKYGCISACNVTHDRLLVRLTELGDRQKEILPLTSHSKSLTLNTKHLLLCFSACGPFRSAAPLNHRVLCPGL